MAVSFDDPSMELNRGTVDDRSCFGSFRFADSLVAFGFVVFRGVITGCF